MTKFDTLLNELETSIESSYKDGVTLEEAEKLASKFLYAQMAVSSELKVADLDSRMRRSGVKALRASVYLAEVQRNEKKPSDVLLEQIINTTKAVSVEQDGFDDAEVGRDELERLYNIFREAHIHFRGLAKGRFD